MVYLSVFGLILSEKKVFKSLKQDFGMLHKYRVVVIIIIGILTLIAASPILSTMLVIPRTEFYTEFWMLDSNHKADNYPFNITRNQNYGVFLGIRNRLGYAAHYVVEVKFRNQTQPAPSSFNHTPSSLPSLLNITAFVADEELWELPLALSFDFESEKMPLQMKFHSLRLNEAVLDLSNLTVSWDSKKSCFLGNLVFELWIHNNTSSSFEYHNRFVSLWVNMTA